MTRCGMKFGRSGVLIGLTIGDILGGNGIKELAANRYAKVCDVAQKLTSQTQTFVDLERSIDIGIINKTFPSDGGSRFLWQIVSY